nr:hypothetical protein CFP56_23904 [Quercus suber]
MVVTRGRGSAGDVDGMLWVCDGSISGTDAGHAHTHLIRYTHSRADVLVMTSVRCPGRGLGSILNANYASDGGIAWCLVLGRGLACRQVERVD